MMKTTMIDSNVNTILCLLCDDVTQALTSSHTLLSFEIVLM